MAIKGMTVSSFFHVRTSLFFLKLHNIKLLIIIIIYFLKNDTFYWFDVGEYL